MDGPAQYLHFGFILISLILMNYLDGVNIFVSTKLFEHELSEQKGRST